MSAPLPIVARIATITRGFHYLLPYQLCLVGSTFAMKRFGYEEDAVSIFVAFCCNAMAILQGFASTCTLVIVTILKTVTPNLFTQISSGMSMVAACLTVTIDTLLLRLYAMDNDVDNITRYYWLLLMALFSAGIDDACIFVIAPEYFSSYDLGTSTSGIVLACFHCVIIKILNSYSLNVDYWLIVSQLTFMLGLSIFAEVLWIAFLMREKIVVPAGVLTSRGGSISLSGFAKGLVKCLPMVLGTSIALSTLFAIYPLIAPFQVVKFDYYYSIQRFCLIIDTVAATIVWFLDAYAEVQSDWYSGTKVWWHMVWVLYVPYFGLAAMFLRCMHYPDAMASRIVLSSPFVAGVLTVTFYIMGCFTFGISVVPLPKNADGYHEIIAPLNKCIGLTVMNVVRYISEAYVQEFKLAKEGIKAGKAWPTDGMSKHSAIRYWIRIAAKVGYANFKEMASADVKQRLGGVARHIVSYRRISSIG